MTLTDKEGTGASPSLPVLGDREQPPDVTVLCIGNPGMCDDAVGHEVARLLEERGIPANAALLQSSNADMGLLGLFRECPKVIVVDALDAGAEPGEVFRFTPEQAGLTSLRSNNIHGMGLGYLVTNAALLGARPEVIVYGIQVGDVCPRETGMLTGEVRRAAAEVAAMVLDELAQAASGG